ncbi:MAG: acyltransferase family protein [Acidobacteriaceae bacterium]
MPDRLRTPSYIPELDGLRGLAIAAVLFYHCHTKLESSHLDVIARWGWTGVNLFFVLSGFLITGIILDSRDDPRFFRNFYARRGLRIWPVYFLLLLLNFFVVPFVFGNFWWAIHEVRTAQWTHYIFFIQNLLFAAMPGTLGPTWSLAIEEQFYVFWAPLARFTRNAILLPLLIAIFIASPLVRLANTGSLGPFHGFLTEVHTLTHLDGLAIGSLVALSLRMFNFSRASWGRFAAGGLVAGIAGAVMMPFHGSNFTDSLLALGFGGMLIAALLVTGRQTAYGRFLTWRPLKYLGTISYGLYLIHVLCFVLIGAFDLKMEKYGMGGDLAVVGVRLILSISAATLLWYGFERPILRLKKYFVSKPHSTQVREPAPVLVAAD